MASAIAAICKTPACRSVFLIDHISMMLGKNVPIGATGGTCPQCGNSGETPFGIYQNVLRDDLFLPRSDEQKYALNRAIAMLRDVIDGELLPEELAKLARHHAPDLAKIWKRIPQSKHDAFGCIAPLYDSFTEANRCEKYLPFR